MKASKFSWRGVFKIGMYFVFALMLLASISAFRESPLLGFAMVAIPTAYAGGAMFNSVRKSVWGMAFLILGVGVLEIYLGVAKGMPVSWVLGGVGFAVYLVARFIKAASGAYRSAFPKGDLPFPKVSPMTHSFDSAFGNTTRRSVSGSTKSRSNGADMDYDSPNGRGGINHIYTEDDPFGLHL